MNAHNIFDETEAGRGFYQQIEPLEKKEFASDYSELARKLAIPLMLGILAFTIAGTIYLFTL